MLAPIRGVLHLLLGVVASASWFMLVGSGSASGPSGAAATAGGGEGGGSMAERGTAAVRCGCGGWGGAGEGGLTEIGVASMGGARGERGHTRGPAGGRRWLGLF